MMKFSATSSLAWRVQTRTSSAMPLSAATSTPRTLAVKLCRSVKVVEKKKMTNQAAIQTSQWRCDRGSGVELADSSGRATVEATVCKRLLLRLDLGSMAGVLAAASAVLDASVATAADAAAFAAAAAPFFAFAAAMSNVCDLFQVIFVSLPTGFFLLRQGRSFLYRSRTS